MRVFALVVLLLPGLALAQSALERSLGESEQLQREAQASQQRIDQLDDAGREALQRYRLALQQREQLEQYNQRLAEMVEVQRNDLQALQEQLDSIEQTQQAVLPLIQRMHAGLQQFVALDLPFLPEERSLRLQQIDELMQRPDISVAEKYRRIVEAYQIESDYGRTLEAWRGSLQQDGEERLVDFLRIGRLMLFYQSLDGREQGWWDRRSGSWQPLDDGYRRSLEQGMRTARQQQVPVMLRLPFPAAVELEVQP